MFLQSLKQAVNIQQKQSFCQRNPNNIPTMLGHYSQDKQNKPCMPDLRASSVLQLHKGFISTNFLTSLTYPPLQHESNQIMHYKSFPSIKRQWRTNSQIVNQQYLQKVLFRGREKVVRNEIKPLWSWQCLPVIPRFKKLKRDDCKFECS